MNKYSRIVALIFTCCFLSGCERGHDLDVESAIGFKVVLFQHPTTGITKTRECNLHPDSQGFDEIAEWLSANRDGWGDYLATPAVGGALISGNGFNLHIYDSSFVLAFTDRAGKPRQLTKDRSSGELDFVFSLPCESSGAPAQYTVNKDVEISEAQREQLVAATIETMIEPPSENLAKADGIGKISQISVMQVTTNPTDDEADHPTEEWTTVHVGSVLYDRIKLSDSREYQPKVTCSSQGDDVWFQDCHEESYVRLQTEWMDKPIDLEGDLTLTDQDVKLLYAAVDDATLVSKHDGEIFTFTSDNIHMMLKHRHVGDRVNVYVTTADNKYGQAIYFKKVWNDDGQSGFAVSEIRCDTE